MLNIPPEIQSLRQPAYLVGGSVRDILLGRTPCDYDIAVPGDPMTYARELAVKKKARVITIGKNEKIVFRIVSGNFVFDITPLKDQSIEADLLQRDFTINSIAYDLTTKKIVDITGGREDLNRKRIRMVSPDIFRRDSIRLIRAYRMAALTGFTIGDATAAAIKSDRHLISAAAGERVRDELFGILNTAGSRSAVEDMAESGVLMGILPELTGLEGCLQNSHHEFDVLRHTLNTFAHLEILLESMSRYFPRSSGSLAKTLHRKRKSVLKLAALLHDIGKPASLTTDLQGRRHFYGHSKIGSRLAIEACERIRLSREERESVAFIVHHHLRPLFLFTQPGKAPLSSRALTRFFLACGRQTPDILLHALADSRAKKHEEDDSFELFVRFTQEMIQRYFNDFRKKRSEKPLINGLDLIDIFGLKPSPRFKAILRQVDESRIAGDIDTRAQALELVKTILGKTE